LEIHYTTGIAYERAAPFPEKNAAAGVSDFSVHGGTALSQEVPTVK
jgi:hypothetical protein